MLCACRNEWFWIKVILLALAGALALANLTSGDGQVIPPPTELSSSGEGWSAIESNALLIRRELSAGAVVVALGIERDIMEHRGLIEELKAPGCAGGDDPVREELLALRGALDATLKKHLPSETKRILNGLTEEKLQDALTRIAYTDNPVSFGLDEFRVTVGFATYTYWQVLVRPDLGKSLLRGEGEQMILLPNTKQAYIKVAFRVPLPVKL